MILKSAQTNCKGDFVNIDPENVPCVNDMKSFDEVGIEIWLIDSFKVSYIILLIMSHCSGLLFVLPL